MIRLYYLLPFLIGLCFVQSSNAQTLVWDLDFESAGGYTASPVESTDNSKDYFIRTDGSNINATFTNIQGSNYFAAQDIDAAPNPGAGAYGSLTITGVAITGYTSLEIRVHIAEDDDGSNQDWDGSDIMHINGRVDAAAYQNLIWVEGQTTSTNTEPKIDTDYNGLGDGTSITDDFTQFTKTITGTGTTFDILVEFDLNSGDEDIAIDNIEIWGIASSTNDTDSEVYDTGAQPATGTIYSIDDTPAEAINVFDFTIEDQGTVDGLVTSVTNVRLYEHTSNTADWTDHIADVILKQGASTITTGVVSITDTEINIPITSGNLDIADNTSEDVEVYIYLNTSNIVDGAIFSCFIDASTHGFTTDASGSDFVSAFILGDFYSNNFTIDINATELIFIQQPTDVDQGSVMAPAVTVAYVDEHGQIDVDYNGAGFELDLTSSSATLAGTVTTSVAPVNGVVTFSDIEYSTSATNETITATDNNGWITSTSEVSNTFDINPLCVAPANQPTILTFGTITSSSIDGSFTAAASTDGYLVVQSTSTPLGAIPLSGTVYNPGDPIGTGTVVQAGSGTTFSATGLASTTTYYFYVFGYNDLACVGAPVYNTTSPLTGSQATLAGPSCSFSDDFNRPDNPTVGGGWTEVSVADNSSVSNQLLINTGGSSGQDYSWQDMNGNYATVISTLTSVITWEFNMRQSRSNPSGFGSSNYGVAFMLGGTTTSASSGNGYAVVLGNSGTTDNVRLVHYTGGIVGGASTSIITGATDFGLEHISVRVTYDPTTNTWELFERNDGGTFTSPASLGPGNSQGTTIDATHVGLNLRYIAAIWNHASGGSEVAEFDNVCISATATAEMDVFGNGLEIADGDNSPDLLDDTDFGDAEVGGTPVTRTFTISNTGAIALNLSGTPIIQLSGSADFAFTGANPTTPLAASSSTTFDITFTPSSTGAINATVSIDNDDNNEGPAYTFDITGNGTNSNQSDIIADAGFAYTSNIDYTSYQSNPITNTSGNVGSFRFTIRDGGASMSDADALGTELSAITFDVTNIDNIRTAALFDGNALVNNAPTINYIGGTIAFSGLSGAAVTAPDNSSKNLTLRVSFLTTVTDNDQLQYQVFNVSAGASGSVFNSSNGGGAISSIVGNRNRLVVTASQLQYSQQPSDATVNINMSPSVTVQGVDANGNLDLDWTDNVSIASTGSMTGDPITVAAVNGVVTFSGVIHTVQGTGFTLTASHATFTSIVSNTFDVITIPFVDGDYRTTGSGNWLNNQAVPAIWERLSSGSWGISNSPSYNTSNSVYIRSGHTITTGGSFANSINLRILDGGVFNVNHQGTSGSVLIYENGTMNVNAAMTNNGNLEVEDNATLSINHQYGNGTATIPALWDGTEIFHPESDIVFNDFDCADDFMIPDNTSISTNTYGAYTAVFGNVIVDFGSNLSSSDDWVMLESGININMAHGDLIFRSNSTVGADMRVGRFGTVTSGIGGDFIVENGYTNTSLINIKTSGLMTFQIEGDMQLDAATTRVFAGSSGTGTVLNIEGDLNITPSGVLNFNSTIASGPTSTINLKGDLTVAGSGLLYNTNGSNQGKLNFVEIGDGLTDATTQTIDVASTSSNENREVNFYVKNGAYIKLINRDFELGLDGALVVENGGVFDFGFNGTTPLNTAISGTQTGTTFSSQQGSTLKITSPDGISTTGSIGNVRVVASNRNFNQTATFHYIGKANQVTGNGITTGSTGKIIICELIDNATSLMFTNSTGITQFNAISPTGGKLDIRIGQVIETETEYISGSTGTLYMSPGTLYRVMKGNSDITSSIADVIPRVDGATYPYILNGGTIELGGNSGGNYFQTLRGSQFRPNYINVKFSGINTRLTDFKNLSSTTVIDSTLEITDDAVVDCWNGNSGTPSPLSFIGNGALVMDDGLMRIRKLTTPNPELDGISADYALTGGTVEFYLTDNTESQLIRGTDSRTTPRTIAYYNIEVNADAANIDDYNVGLAAGIIMNGTMNINSPAVFQTDQMDHVDGVGVFNVLPDATYKYADPFGITLGTSTAISAGAIRVSSNRTITNFPSTASYGFVSTRDMVTGNGLPITALNIYLDRTLTSDDVDLTNNLTINGNLDMRTGNIMTDGNLIELGSSTAVLGNLVYDDTDEPFIVGDMKRWFSTATNSGDASGLFPIGDTVDATAPDIHNRFALVEFSSVKSAGGSLTTQFVPVNMGVSGIPISNIAAVGGCVIFDVTTTEDQGYWQIDDADGLNGGNYDIRCTGEGFDNISNICQLTLLKRIGGAAWLESGAHTLSYYLDNPSTNQPTVQRTGVSGWSNFGFGGGLDNLLPVELLNFSAVNDNNNSLLTWTTLSEVNNDRFDIYHSTNGINFEKIGEKDGFGTTSDVHQYDFVHFNPPTGENYYFLHQIDFGGSSEDSDIELVIIEGNQELQVVNTLAESTLELSIETDNEFESDIRIFNMNGKLMISQDIFVQDGIQNISIDVRELPKAMYLIQWHDGYRPYEYKFIKL